MISKPNEVKRCSLFKKKQSEHPPILSRLHGAKYYLVVPEKKIVALKKIIDKMKRKLLLVYSENRYFYTIKQQK